MPRGGRRFGRLLVDVRSVSGRTYAAGTAVRLVGSGATVDAWAGGEWVPLRWWEFAEARPSEPVAHAGDGPPPEPEGGPSAGGLERPARRPRS
jgi:hypothetical protein